MKALTIGLISETVIQQHYLKNIVTACGYKVGQRDSLLVNDLIRKMDGKQATHHTASAVDAWIVDVDIDRLDDSQDDKVHHWLSLVEQPIIFSEGNTHHAGDSRFLAWSRQLSNKLMALEGQIQLEANHHKRHAVAKNIWILAASTGGPEVVKQFLNKMPADLGVGFLYAQHIDATQIKVLSETIAKHSAYQCSVAAHGDIVTENSIHIISPRYQTELQQNGALLMHEQRLWRGIYTPSIDQIVSNVANLYRQAAGVIFFTGMGDDGATGCRFMAHHGGQVWAQSISSCVAPSMPQEVINTGYVNKMDTPENLALHLKIFLSQRNLTQQTSTHLR